MNRRKSGRNITTFYCTTSSTGTNAFFAKENKRNQSYLTYLVISRRFKRYTLHGQSFCYLLLRATQILPSCDSNAGEFCHVLNERSQAYTPSLVFHARIPAGLEHSGENIITSTKVSLYPSPSILGIHNSHNTGNTLHEKGKIGERGDTSKRYPSFRDHSRPPDVNNPTSNVSCT